MTAYTTFDYNSFGWPTSLTAADSRNADAKGDECQRLEWPASCHHLPLGGRRGCFWPNNHL